MLRLLWLVPCPRPLKLKWVLGGVAFVTTRFGECCVCTMGSLYRVRHSQDIRGHEIVFFQKNRGCVISYAHNDYPPQHRGSPCMFCSQAWCEHSPGSPPKEWLALFPQSGLPGWLPCSNPLESPPGPGIALVAEGHGTACCLWWQQEDLGRLEVPHWGLQGMFKSNIWNEISFENVFKFVSWQIGALSWGPCWWVGVHVCR